MISSCTHCGATYQLPDKMLGKKARCKSCDKLFVLTPDEPEISLDEMEEVKPPQRGGSTTRMSPVSADDGDPLDALAEASFDSDTGMAPARSRASMNPITHPQGAYEEEERRGPKRMAKGAKASMVMGITGAVFALAGNVCSFVAMNTGDQDTLVMTGVIGMVLMGAGAVFGMIAVANANAAGSKIKRARHPLSGKDEALIGSLSGTFALVMVVIVVIVGGIWLSKRGGIVFEETVNTSEDN